MTASWRAAWNLPRAANSSGVSACANLLALESTATGPFNVGTGVETDVNRLADLTLRASGSRSEVRHGPAKQGEQRRSVVDVSTPQSYTTW